MNEKTGLDPRCGDGNEIADRFAAIYQSAYDRFAGPPQSRHACNHHDYHKAGLLAVAMAERDEINELVNMLKLAVRQNSLDMLLTGDELRKCEAAIAKAAV